MAILVAPALPTIKYSYHQGRQSLWLKTFVCTVCPSVRVGNFGEILMIICTCHLKASVCCGTSSKHSRRRNNSNDPCEKSFVVVLLRQRLIIHRVTCYPTVLYFRPCARSLIEARFPFSIANVFACRVLMTPRMLSIHVALSKTALAFLLVPLYHSSLSLWPWLETFA